MVEFVTLEPPRPMIRYSITIEDFTAAIDAEKPTWRNRAKTRTEELIRSRKYGELSGIWKEIKRVFIRLQEDKYLFCERQLAGGAPGAIEHDLEHFRPKSRVRKWPAISSQPRIYFSTGEESPRGYYWLAYHPLNYGAACKVCNTMLKRDYFPIAGVRAEPTDSFADLRTKEQPDLIYPIGDADGDPESLISFIGIVPVPVKKTGPRNRRARVTIAFFDLQKREELLSRSRSRRRDLAIDAPGLQSLFSTCKSVRNCGESEASNLSLWTMHFSN